MPAQPSLAPKGVFLALAAVAGWSMNFLFSRMLADAVPPFTLCLLRTLTALVLFTPLALRSFVRQWPAFKTHLLFYIAISLAGLGLFNALIYLAGRTTTAVNMALLTTASPVFTLVLGRLFLGECLGPRRLFGIAAAVTGIVLLTVRGDLNALLAFRGNSGDVLMLLASMLFAAYTVLMRFKPQGVNDDSLLLGMFLLSALALLPLAAWENSSGPAFAWTPKIFAAVLYLGAVASIFCYWCWTRAIASIGSGNVALIYYTLPLFSGVEALLILGEQLHWTHFAGGGLIIAGVLAATRSRSC